MADDRDRAGGQDLADSHHPLPVRSAHLVLDGLIWDVQRDEVDLGDGGVVRREYLRHPGAVAVIAMDADDRVLLLRQYRHPVRHRLWEPPAGLCDVPGEPLLLAAQRELAEEADLRAARWNTLVDYYTSPGGSDEAIRVFLARDLSPVPQAERFTREAEEIGMVPRWCTVAEAVTAVLDGRVHNPSAVVGVLATAAAMAGGWAALRPADAPWQHRVPERS